MYAIGDLFHGRNCYRIWATVERARAEEVLQKSEEKYLILFEAIYEGFVVFETAYGNRERFGQVLTNAIKYIAEEAGADDYLAQLFGIEEILANVEKYLPK